MKATRHILFGLCFLSLVACKVDERYSIDKFNNLDTSMRVFEEGISLPLGYTSQVSIDNALGTKNEQGEIVYPDHFNADGKGNYYVDYSGNQSKYDFTLPEVKDFGTPSLDQITLSLTNPYYPAKKSGNDSFDLGTFTENGALNLQQDLGENILDVKDIKVDGDVIINVSTNNTMSGAIFAKAGSYIEFPSYLTVKKNDSQSGYEVQNGNKIYFSSNFSVPGAKLTLKLQEINVEKAIQAGKAQITAAHKLVISDNVKFSITIRVDGAYTIAAVKTISLSFTTNMTSPKVQQAVVRISASTNLDPTKFNFNLPSNISTESNLDLNDPTIKFTVDCSRGGDIVGEKFQFKANLKISSYTNSGQDLKKTIALNDVLVTEGSNVIYVSRLGGKATVAGETDYVVSEISELFSGSLPDAVSINDVTISIVNEDTQKNPVYYTVTPSLKPTVTTNYLFSSYLDFLKNSKLKMNFPVSEVSIDLSSLKTDNIYLDFDFENAIPLKLNPDMIITYKVGDTYEEAHAWGENLVILPGNPGSPTSTHTTMKLESKNGYIDAITKIQVIFEGSVTDETVMLNRGQYVRLNNVAMGVDGGINVTINSEKEEQ